MKQTKISLYGVWWVQMLRRTLPFRLCVRKDPQCRTAIGWKPPAVPWRAWTHFRRRLKPVWDRWEHSLGNCSELAKPKDPVWLQSTLLNQHRPLLWNVFASKRFYEPYANKRYKRIGDKNLHNIKRILLPCGNTTNSLGKRFEQLVFKFTCRISGTATAILLLKAYFLFVFTTNRWRSSCNCNV